jgi:hypothetical protein
MNEFSMKGKKLKLDASWSWVSSNKTTCGRKKKNGRKRTEEKKTYS